MYISLNWLNDYVKIPKSVSPEELGEKLTLHAVEIDGVAREADKYKNILVGKILEIKPHPDADKLQIAKVDIKREILEIVCGAPNIKAGQLVPLALPGAVLPGGLEIKAAEIRGTKSGGMLCAEDELGLGNDHAGILILEERAKIGQPLSDYLDLKDVVYELDNKSITNRPDLWGHFGLARDIAAFLNLPFDGKLAKLADEDIYVDKEDYELNVKVEDKELCPRYMAAVMDGLVVKESPAWLKKRLITVGVKPINNIVDISNYVMLELGQPMHAFDADDLSPEPGQSQGIRIGVRPARKKEKIRTLDSVERELQEDMLLITDQNRPIGLAGIMGGENSEIKDKTSRIVLEAANFDFVSIRKTSAALELRTEASKRFEKSLDPRLCAAALARAIGLIKEVCPGAKVAGRIVDIDNRPPAPAPIELSLERLAATLGFGIGVEAVVSILGRLGFKSEKKDSGFLSVSVPSWRAGKDVSGPEDLAEEIARIYGYGNIEPKMPRVEIKAPPPNRSRKFENEIKAVLSVAGASEVCNYSFVDEAQLIKMGIDPANHIRLLNPIAKDKSLLRQSLVTNMIANITSNQARRPEIEIFEIGSVFLPLEGALPRVFKGKEFLPRQEKRLAILCAGEAESDLIGRAKGWLELLAAKFGLEIRYEPQDNAPPWAEAGRSAQILSAGLPLGAINQAGQAACKKCGVKKHLATLEVSLPGLYKSYEKNGGYRFREFAKYPPLIRDLAFVISDKVLYNDIKEEISGFHDFIRAVELFDIYHGEKLGKNKKSLAFRLTYQADKTLTGPEVDAIQAGLLARLEERFEAKIRDF